LEKGRIEMKTIGVVEKMENITQEEPTAAFPHCIAKNGFKTFSPSDFQEEVGKVNPRDNGELQ
jgi:hypothetical protein